jgi:hydroxypyruvate isomerase
MRKLTAKNLRALSEIGKAHHVKFYLEGLCFTPVNRLDQQIELLEETACENVGLVLDFYHLWDGGTKPEFGATLNNAEGDDDDCKYHVKFTATPIRHAGLRSTLRFAHASASRAPGRVPPFRNEERRS